MILVSVPTVLRISIIVHEALWVELDLGLSKLFFCCGRRRPLNLFCSVCVCVCTLNRTLPYTVPWYVAGFYYCILVLSAQGWYGTVRYPKQAAMESTACRAALPSKQALEMKR